MKIHCNSESDPTYVPTAGRIRLALGTDAGPIPLPGPRARVTARVDPRERADRIREAADAVGAHIIRVAEGRALAVRGLKSPTIIKRRGRIIRVVCEPM